MGSFRAGRGAMIATDSFVFVHLHKCGGSFVTEALLRFVPGARRVGYHYPLALLPERYRGLPVLGVVRNPWDFYVSYHWFQAGLYERAAARNAALSPAQLEAMVATGDDPWNGIDVVFEELTDRGALPFAEACRRYAGFSADPALFERVAARLPRHIDHRAHGEPVQRGEAFRGMNLRREDLEPFRGKRLGLCSLLFAHLYGDAAEVELLRQENLREALLDWLSDHGVDVSQAMRAFIADGAPVNTSRHDQSVAYYDSELAACVRDADAQLIRRFQYEL